MKGVDLATGSAETGEFDDGMAAEMEAGAKREREQVDAEGGDVFAELARIKAVPGRGELGKEFRLEKMDLHAVSSVRAFLFQVHMLNREATVSVAMNTLAGEQIDGVLG